MTKKRVPRAPVVQPLDQSIRLIALTQGQVTTVNARSYEWAMQWNWTAMWSADVNNYYAKRQTEDGKTLLLHRQLMGEHHPQIDHRNGNTLDNRFENLRACTPSNNLANRRMQKNNKSGYKGVSWHKSAHKFQAFISVNGKSIYLGVFESKLAASKAYDDAAIKFFGEFARLNH